MTMNNQVIGSLAEFILGKESSFCYHLSSDDTSTMSHSCCTKSGSVLELGVVINDAFKRNFPDIGENEINAVYGYSLTRIDSSLSYRIKIALLSVLCFG